MLRLSVHFRHRRRIRRTRSELPRAAPCSAGARPEGLPRVFPVLPDGQKHESPPHARQLLPGLLRPLPRLPRTQQTLQQQAQNLQRRGPGPGHRVLRLHAHLQNGQSVPRPRRVLPQAGATLPRAAQTRLSGVRTVLQSRQTPQGAPRPRSVLQDLLLAVHRRPGRLHPLQEPPLEAQTRPGRRENLLRLCGPLSDDRRAQDPLQPGALPAQGGVR
uniref:(northern house mosquito) hypothetical protein n=1 Tax=Culex pipiens TaxID=7175 RepID=A0A8D8I565_CULPI